MVMDIAAGNGYTLESNTTELDNYQNNKNTVTINTHVTMCGTNLIFNIQSRLASLQHNAAVRPCLRIYPDSIC